MKKIIIYISIICLCFACKDETQTSREEATQSKEEFLEKNKLNIPKKGQLKELNATQKRLVQDWVAFQAINESMKNINTSSRFAIVEDLGQLATNIEAIEEQQFPKDLDIMQIRSRLLVLRTKALKLQDDAQDDNFSNDAVAKEIAEMNTVFHTVCNQIQQASELNIDPKEILGNTLKKDSSATTPANEVFKSTKEEKPKSKSKKILQQQFDEQINN